MILAQKRQKILTGHLFHMHHAFGTIIKDYKKLLLLLYVHFVTYNVYILLLYVHKKNHCKLSVH